MNELKLNNAKAFLYGQIELYKIEFAKEGNNKYLEVMNDLNKTIEVIIFLETTLKTKTKQS